MESCLKGRSWRSGLFLLILCFAAFWGLPPAKAGSFKQEALSYRSDGTPLPFTVINPATRDDLKTHDFSLGRGRFLQIQTNLPQSRDLEIKDLAEVVRRCYSFLERETDRSIPSGVLLYLIQFPQRPRCYRFEAEPMESDGWAQVRVALLDEGQPLLGRGASEHVREFLLDTLPHELTHTLLNICPTVAHDLDNGPPLGTRWFSEGVCEVLAKGFSAQEDSDFHRRALKKRHPEALLLNPELEELIWHWGQANSLDWDMESDLYGLSMLMVTAWMENMDLRDLLGRMSEQGGNLTGTDLLDLLSETAGLDSPRLVERARRLALRYSTSEPLSALVPQ